MSQQLKAVFKIYCLVYFRQNLTIIPFHLLGLMKSL